jgi:DNA-binding IclR family transcriptional regulator
MPPEPPIPAVRRSRGRPKASTGKPRGIQSASSGLDVLKVMLATDSPMHLREIAAGVGRDASSVYRYLVSFVEAGLVMQDEASGRYDLGPMAIQLGLAALRRIDGLAVAAEELGRLVRSVQADGHVTVWGSNGPTVLRWLGRPSDVVVRVQEGSVLPVAASSTGRAWAAYLPAEIVKAALQRELASPPPGAAGTRAQRRQQLAAAAEVIRQQGFSYASGERRVDVDALCAPIFDRNGTMAFAITLVAESPSLSPTAHPEVVRHLLAATHAVSQRLGAPPR